jgi:hypothetical protein
MAQLLKDYLRAKCSFISVAFVGDENTRIITFTREISFGIIRTDYDANPNQAQYSVRLTKYIVLTVLSFGDSKMESAS